MKNLKKQFRVDQFLGEARGQTSDCNFVMLVTVIQRCSLFIFVESEHDTLPYLHQNIHYTPSYNIIKIIQNIRRHSNRMF